MATTKDAHKAHTPKAVVIVGGQTVICESYNIVSNDKEEVSTCTIRIPLDNIDSSVFANRNPADGIFDVQVWAGYITDDVDPDAQLLNAVKLIAAKQTPPLFSKRFDGYVIQPEWEFGESRYLTLSCVDWTQILRETRMDVNQKIQGSYCECRNLVSLVQKHFTGIKISIDSYPGSQKLGTHDAKKVQDTYNPGSKNLFEVLQEIARHLGYSIYTDGKEISIKEPYKKVHVWSMYYGDKDNQKDAGGNAVGQYFSNLRIRYGTKGRASKSNLFVNVVGIDITGKDAKTKKIDEWFPKRPKDFSGADESQIIKIVVNGPIKKQYAQNHAKNIYTRARKSLVTGNFDLPFANNYLKVGDLVTFVGDDSDSGKEISFLKNLNFSISAITEEFNNSGYTQTVEFETNPSAENAPKDHPKPNPPKRGK